MSKLYSTQEVAKMIGAYDASHVRKLIKRGVLKGNQVGKAWVITSKAIKDYLLEKRFKQIDKELQEDD